ncbi:hypothetical protein [Nostoc commune]|uniref:hypothetical protein n=1 Tax=Nostoc commune TaxID=1178 RepID=UPI001E582B98|nr:hypothetical protein [Nostoc commune]
MCDQFHSWLWLHPFADTNDAKYGCQWRGLFNPNCGEVPGAILQAVIVEAIATKLIIFCRLRWLSVTSGF